jgi:cobalamin biosynthesis protein CobW
MKNERAQALVVSGFLGSGKTTLVRHLLERGQREGIRTAVVSNEFGELGIDQELLASQDGDFVELAGGCVCCRLSDDLLLTLQKLWERSRPERVIVETSGVALPYDTLINFWREPVRQWSTDESSVVVVSAEQVATGRDLDSTFEDQVCSADYLLLSKTDLVSEDDARHAEELLARMQPDAVLLHASFGRVEPAVFFPPDPGSRPRRDEPAMAGDHESHGHEQYETEELHFAPGIAEDELRRTLEARSPLRAKGFVETADGLRLVQGVARHVEIGRVQHRPPDAMIGRVVVIERRPRAGHWPPSPASGTQAK